ncbi:MAG: hypothetical protein HF967_05715 [Methanosarcinales archaeon]|nr:hypothetical protein [Methanosarcinales archaeon]
MGTITVNINDEIEKEFKAIANITHKDKKEYLERAIIEAIQRWIYEKKQEKITEEALKLLETNFDFGKRLYKNRSDLYEQ